MLKIYTRTQCASCVTVKRFLDIKGAQYEVVNLDENPERQEEAISLSGARTVPVITNGSGVVIGWNPGKLMALLA